MAKKKRQYAERFEASPWSETIAYETGLKARPKPTRQQFLEMQSRIHDITYALNRMQGLCNSLPHGHPWRDIYGLWARDMHGKALSMYGRLSLAD